LRIELAHQEKSSMADTIEAELADLAEEFELLGDWEERYRHLIDLGRTLEPLPEAEHTDATRVHGCASQVWLSRRSDGDGRLRWLGDSDAHLVRGLIAVVLRLYNGRDAAQILAFDAREGLKTLGLDQALSAQRSNGLKSMVERIRKDASAAV
jgi:cysteine desulfuration protein SufE